MSRHEQDDELWVIRHGETEWSRDGLHTSHTELELTPEGEDVAR
ncbi:MAG: histidine phosphatase family protein, partial [Marmoricola sp.]